MAGFLESLGRSKAISTFYSTKEALESSDLTQQATMEGIEATRASRAVAGENLKMRMAEHEQSMKASKFELERAEAQEARDNTLFPIAPIIANLMPEAQEHAITRLRAHGLAEQGASGDWNIRGRSRDKVLELLHNPTEQANLERVELSGIQRRITELNQMLNPPAVEGKEAKKPSEKEAAQINSAIQVLTNKKQQLDASLDALEKDPKTGTSRAWKLYSGPGGKVWLDVNDQDNVTKMRMQGYKPHEKATGEGSALDMDKEFRQWEDKIKSLKQSRANIEKGVDMFGAELSKDQIAKASATIDGEIARVEQYLRTNFPRQWEDYTAADPEPVIAGEVSLEEEVPLESSIDAILNELERVVE